MHSLNTKKKISSCILRYFNVSGADEKLRSGLVYINGNSLDPGTPFGGYKQSGNGREGGIWGLEEFLEVKTITGWK